MHSILGWASFCMNYCSNAAWHGVNQPVALLRCNGSPGGFDSSLQVIFIVGSGVSNFPLDNTHRGQVRRVCWPIKHSNTMVIEPAFGSFGSVGRCQVLLENEVSISSKTSRWHGSPNHHRLWKFHTGLQATWILCLSTLQWLQLQFTSCGALPSVWISFAWQYSQACSHIRCLSTFPYPISSF